MSIRANVKLERLEYTFPELTEANQQYVLGIAVGLNRAQDSSAAYNDPAVRSSRHQKQPVLGRTTNKGLEYSSWK
jgi:hypothetical protein